MLIDTHAHLYWDSFKEDLGSIVARSTLAGVTTVVNVGTDVSLSKKALKQTEEELANIPGFTAYSTIGIHPHEAVKYYSDSDVSIRQDVEKLKQIYLSNTRKIIGVGECGLDFFFDQEKVLQKKLFQAQIDLAKELNLPLIVHCRDDRSEDPQTSEAWNKALEMIGNHPAILHCYSGLIPTTNAVLQTTNLLVSFAATITYPKNEYLREAVKLLPLEKIVLETDCPFLPPQSKRGQRNEPANIKEIAELIAQLKVISPEEVADQTTINAEKIFNIK